MIWIAVLWTLTISASSSIFGKKKRLKKCFLAVLMLKLLFSPYRLSKSNSQFK